MRIRSHNPVDSFSFPLGQWSNFEKYGGVEGGGKGEKKEREDSLWIVNPITRLIIKYTMSNETNALRILISLSSTKFFLTDNDEQFFLCFL